MIQLKRVYAEASPGDGRRFLVERLWPRGIGRSRLHEEAWLKDVAPSTQLRRWFGHEPKRWNDFRLRYFQELEDRGEAWKPIYRAAERGRVTLIYSSRDPEHNNALALKEFIERELKKGKARGRTRRAKAA